MLFGRNPMYIHTLCLYGVYNILYTMPKRTFRHWARPSCSVSPVLEYAILLHTCILFIGLKYAWHKHAWRPCLYNQRVSQRCIGQVVLPGRWKGQCHEIFDFWFFHESVSSKPPSIPIRPEYPIRTVSNFFENLRRYSQVKVHHRYQRHTTLAANLPPVSLTPVANLPPVSTTQAKLVAKFSAGVFDTSGKFAAGVGCRWYRWCTLTCEYLREFSKKFEMVLMGYSGAGGKLIHEKKTRSKKSRDTVLLTV